ncbi:putative sulfite oxidase cytochrome subunit SoxD [Methylorubrum extorquens DM4]|uniref:Sulfite oxidase cytochrome subunit SoxD n=1 Tax=Methylorubrum extorquens (strain DSM 6343 / CIP 106787 / DM4) TaxID=661410 RepID=C7CBM1_METED|nr:cytochrome c [Methylorubrum extorquens]CAX22392.1 putative sulfite oxidase cytochrome subunit SoxD [Methylorubrum extorquens DM4]
MSRSRNGIAAAFAAALLGAASPAASERLNIGRAATPEEIKGWDIDVRPDGKGLPVGKGTAALGETIYGERCASCHGEFGEGAGRWPELAGGAGTIKSDNPVKTVGSYWPYVTTVFDFVHRAMPFGAAQTLTPDETYSVTAYLLYLNDILKDQDFEVNEKNLADIRLPNEKNFFMDDRETAEKEFWTAKPCMKDCLPKAATITGRARILDVTPEKASEAAKQSPPVQ